MRRIFDIRVAWIAVLLTWLEPGSFNGAAALAQPGPLTSWNNGAAKQAITAFVAAVTKQGLPDFVSPAERIATNLYGDFTFQTRYNIAPSQEAKLLRCGLVLSWAPDPGTGQRMSNARFETLLEKPLFK